MTDLPFHGPDKHDCPCGCGAFGVLAKKVQRDGLQHVKRCPCKRCCAPRYKANARGREHETAAATRGRRNIGSGAFGGNDGVDGLCEFEETAEVAIVRGLRRWLENRAVQAKFSKLDATHGKPRARVLSWDGRPRAVVMWFEDWRDLQRELAGGDEA